MRGLASRCYLEPATALTEREKIFDRSWQFVCHGSDLPAAGTAIRFDWAGRSAVVMRGRDGQLHGFRNSCRHRGSRLVDGDAHTGLAFCVDARLRCPYHGWTYDETGSLASVPAAATVRVARRREHLAPARACRRVARLVFVAFELPHSAGVAGIERTAEDADGSHIARTCGVSASRAIHPLRADWKLACEHLLDLSHLAVARPALKPGSSTRSLSSRAVNSRRSVRGMEGRAICALAGARLRPASSRDRAPSHGSVFVWPTCCCNSCPTSWPSSSAASGDRCLCDPRSELRPARREPGDCASHGTPLRGCGAVRANRT
jgi:nitrite reductase/ring-hydroxylating ferredoxin subunit